MKTKVNFNSKGRFMMIFIIVMLILVGLGGNAQIPYAQQPLIQTEVDTNYGFVPRQPIGIVYETALGFVITKKEQNPYRFNQTVLVKESIGPGHPKYDSMLVAFYKRKAFRDSVQAVQDSIRKIVFSSRAWLEGLRIDSTRVIHAYDYGFKEYVLSTYGINFDNGNRSPTETILLGGSWFDLDWFGFHTAAQKDAIKAGITHGIEDFSVSNSGNPCKMDIVASSSLGGVLSITTTNWILTNLGEGLTWVAAFNLETINGSNQNGTSADITIEWNKLLSWDLSTKGGPAGADHNLMYLFMH